MKLLVMSDSHRNIGHMLFAVEQTKPDAIAHLGDHIIDAIELRRKLPGMEFYMVMGNCDFSTVGGNELLLQLEGVKIYMTHGHIYGVKSGYDALIKQAQRQKADLALFGHTHQAMIQQTDGLWLMNPGQMKNHDCIYTASYGIVTIKDGTFDCSILYIPQ
jgi:putative phosphoesterase